MKPFLFDEREEPAALLEALLDTSGIQYLHQKGQFRFLFSSRGYRWETVCQCREGGVMVYGRYPFQVRERTKALEACCVCNEQVIRGGMFLAGAELVFRTWADTDDPVTALQSLSQAITYNAAVMAQFWDTARQSA